MTWPRLLEELLRRAGPPAAAPLAQHWTAWARRLVEGRARADAVGAGPPMTLLLPGRAWRAPDRASWLGHRIQLAVRVLHAHEPLSAAPPGRRGAPANRANPATGRAAAPAPAAQLHPRLVIRPPAPREAPGSAAPEWAPSMAVAAGRVTVRRLVEERRRVEQLSHPGRASTTAAPHVATDTAEPAGVDPLTGWALPVTRDLRAATAAGADRSGASEATSTRRFTEPGAPPPVDVERLADQVVRQIDRRIVAHRERVGRI